MSVASSDKYGTLGVAQATVELGCSGMGTVGFQISGTWAGTLTFEGTVDHATWQSLNVALTNSTTQVTTTTANGLYVGACAGLRTIRVRCSAYSSGEATVQVLVAGTSGGSGSVVAVSGGNVTSYLETSTIYNGTTALTPKFVAVAASSSGDNTLVTGVALKKIRVLTYMLSVSAAVNAKFQSSTAGDLTGLFYFAANSGATAGFCQLGHFETVAGEDLQLNLSGAVPVGGYLLYVEV
jgi:hypothetical protein